VSYRMLQLGMDFTPRQLGKLAAVLDNEQALGYELVFIFPVTVTTCLFFKSEQYIAVLRSRDVAAQSPPPTAWGAAPPPPPR
jgi:hypothetical protein